MPLRRGSIRQCLRLPHKCRQRRCRPGGESERHFRISLDIRHRAGLFVFGVIRRAVTRHRRCCSWGDWRFQRFRCGRENGDVDAGSAISVLTCLSVFIWKWVDPIHDLMGPNGCSTVWRRRRIFAGLRSSLACTASRTASCSQHDIRRSFPVVVLDPCIGSTSSAGRLRLQTSAFLHSLGQKRS
jgi:hypothetical protein